VRLDDVGLDDFGVDVGVDLRIDILVDIRDSLGEGIRGGRRRAGGAGARDRVT
jgi:hypothetical protein